MIRLMNSPKLCLLLCLVILSIARIKGQNNVCSPDTYAQKSTFQKNLNHLLSSLSSNTNQSDGFYGTTVSSQGNNSDDTVCGLFQCLGYATVQACQKCVSEGIKDILRRCPNKTGAVAWYDKCWLHYSDRWLNYTDQCFLSKLEEEPNAVVLNKRYATDTDNFKNLLGETLTAVAKKASEGGSKKKYATKEANISSFETLHAMAQCTPDISEIDCLSCLSNSISYLPYCCNGLVGATILKPSCYLRYETYAFYPEAPPPPAPSPESTSKGQLSRISAGIIIAIAVPAVTFILLCFLCLKRRARKDASVPKQSVDISSVESLQFDLDTIRTATNDFSPDNKLGQGGFGEVFKGVLPGGQELAVKRLSSGSKQGVGEFKNEVVTMAKLQHRNLVRLLGFCLDEEEKILIYEFLPNRSLDNFLFGLENQGKLNWSTRYKIIEGITRGMLYLHEDSQLKIIHRDLKASNVLLDEDLNPKISDFGMAKIFEVDQTQTSTSKVVGTFGYMAPEYAMHGHISIKSDIYSFGVLILEIISGKKNTSFYISSYADHLLSYAWRLWREGRPLELVDPSLRDSCSRNEVIKCINVSLLCIQENPALRPTIQSIMVMLSSHSVTLSDPREPAFFVGRHTTDSNNPAIYENSSDQSTSKSAQWSVDKDPITDFDPR
ncbi:putative receptor-like protein kinase At4g00960 [Neltuma alba]|uniref:putative receptor-like protein kinase At4g00960 n=1 Tax=Neltuma alba TaxID=207710 RepID=UPI0010A4A285|nr:putative receptor-like protein kinase At4g00960 [Prosopis alba]